MYHQKIKIFVLVFFLLVFGIKAQSKKTEVKQAPSTNKNVQPPSTRFANNKITYKIISAANNTFCYDIFIDGKLMIHMPSLTGAANGEGFKTKAEAEKTAALLIKKIKNGELISEK